MSRTLTKVLLGLCIVSAIAGGYLISVGYLSGGAMVVTGILFGVISYRQLRSSATGKHQAVDRPPS